MFNEMKKCTLKLHWTVWCTIFVLYIFNVLSKQNCEKHKRNTFEFTVYSNIVLPLSILPYFKIKICIEKLKIYIKNYDSI